MKISQTRFLPFIAALLTIGAIDASAQCATDNTLLNPLRSPPAASQNFANYLGIYGGVAYNGYHPGIDVGVRPGTQVFAPANGVVERARSISSNLAGIVILRHSGQFLIPAQNGSAFYYGASIETSILTALVHVVPAVIEGQCVAKGQLVATVADLPVLGDHLHWEIGTGWQDRGLSRGSNGSVFGRNGNWTNLGYFKNVQMMVDDGARDPSTVTAANSTPPISGEQRADQLLRKCATSRGLAPYVTGLGNAYSSGDFRIQLTQGSLQAIAVPLRQSTSVLHYFFNGWATVDISICN